MIENDIGSADDKQVAEQASDKYDEYDEAEGAEEMRELRLDERRALIGRVWNSPARDRMIADVVTRRGRADGVPESVIQTVLGQQGLLASDVQLERS